MESIDKLITAQTQIIMIREQLVALMKQHYTALTEFTSENPLLASLVPMYTQMINTEEKNIDWNIETLNLYKGLKK